MRRCVIRWRSPQYESRHHGTKLDNDTWDLASSVGVTATMVAVQRALATRSGTEGVNDPYAEPLVRRSAWKPSSATSAVNPVTWFPTTRTLADGMAARTRLFDKLVTEAPAAGVRRFVILASGLDARAYRLPWPAVQRSTKSTSRT